MLWVLVQCVTNAIRQGLVLKLFKLAIMNTDQFIQSVQMTDRMLNGSITESIADLTQHRTKLRRKPAVGLCHSLWPRHPVIADAVAQNQVLMGVDHALWRRFQALSAATASQSLHQSRW